MCATGTSGNADPHPMTGTDTVTNTTTAIGAPPITASQTTTATTAVASTATAATCFMLRTPML